MNNILHCPNKLPLIFTSGCPIIFVIVVCCCKYLTKMIEYGNSNPIFHIELMDTQAADFIKNKRGEIYDIKRPSTGYITY